MNGIAHRRVARALNCRALSLPVLLWLIIAAGHASATVGIAEYRWYFHDQPGRWIEWHHGDICPPHIPGKDCVIFRSSRTVERSSGLQEPAAYNNWVQYFYLSTVLALLPFAGGLAALVCLWRRWRNGGAYTRCSALRSPWAVGLVALVACVWMPKAFAVLFPARPGSDGWDVVILLSLNIFIVAAPWTLWRAYRCLFASSAQRRCKGAMLSLIWLALVCSSVMAPFLFWGPPNLLMFLFPPLMLPNALASLLMVWLTSKGYDAFRQKLTKVSIH